MNFDGINWGMLSVLVAIFFGIVTISLTLKFRKIKKFSLIEVSNIKLVDTHHLENKIKILHEEKEVDNVYLLILKLINDGNKAIPKTDYEREVIISLNNDAEILSAEVINKTPNNIDAELENIIDNKIRFKPLLLNSKQSFSIKMWITSETTPIIAEIDDRIEDVNIKHIKKSDIDYKKSMEFIYEFFIMIAVILTLIIAIAIVGLKAVSLVILAVVGLIIFSLIYGLIFSLVDVIMKIIKKRY